MIDSTISDANKTKSFWSGTIKSGLLTASGLIIYFLIMRLFNLHKNLSLHYLNVIVMFFGIRNAIIRIKNQSGYVKYFDGLKTGIIVSLFTIIPFAIFMTLFVTVIDPSFLTFLQENSPIGDINSVQRTVINAIGIIVTEGLVSGFMLTYILMQYYKSDQSEII